MCTLTRTAEPELDPPDVLDLQKGLDIGPVTELKLEPL